MIETPDPLPLEGIIITGPEDPGQMVTVQERSPLDIFTTPGVVQALIERVRQESTKGFTPDLSTEKGRKEIASRARRVASAKVFLDDLGKTEVARLKALPQQVDAGRKALRDGFEAIQTDIRKPLTEWEARRDVLQKRLAIIQNTPATLFRADSIAIQTSIDTITATPADEATWQEFAQEATSIKLVTLATLQEMLEKAQKAEEDARELDRLKKEEADRKAEEERERLRKEGEVRAQEAVARQIGGPIAAAVAPLPQPTADQQADPPAPTGAQPPAPVPAAGLLSQEVVPPLLAAAHVEHRRAFNREALADLEAALGATQEGSDYTDMAKAALTAIVTGKVRHIAITY